MKELISKNCHVHQEDEINEVRYTFLYCEDGQYSINYIVKKLHGEILNEGTLFLDELSYQEAIQAFQFLSRDTFILYTYELAYTAHKGQTDRGGKSYINHPLRVAMTTEDNLDSIILGLLHDVVEDTGYTVEQIYDYFQKKDPNLGEYFNLNCKDQLIALTHIKEPFEEHSDYIKRVMKYWASIETKIADLTDNLDISRIPNPSKEDLKRCFRYKCVLQMLKVMRDTLTINEFGLDEEEQKLVFKEEFITR